MNAFCLSREKTDQVRPTRKEYKHEVMSIDLISLP